MRRIFGLAFLVTVTAATPAAAATLTVLANFTEATGSFSQGNLTVDPAGNLYGTTSSGGPLQGSRPSQGTVFEFERATGSLTALAGFNGANGASPIGGLVADKTGNFYGTTGGGGASDLGTVFKFDRAIGGLTALASFNGANGAFPESGLIADKAGNFFGTTYGDGAHGYGTTFELNRSSGRLTTLASFDSANGHPMGSLAVDAAGNFYGTAIYGGANTDGTVFRLDRASGRITTLVNFDGANGSSPFAGLVADTAGNLYGTTAGGGASNQGTIFRLNIASGGLTTLASFSGADGAIPESSLILDAAGNLYGTTEEGGASRYGTIFKLDQMTGDLTVLASLDDATGNYGSAGLIADGAGNLYGATPLGGASGDGTIFELSGTGFVVASTKPVPEPGAAWLLLGAGVLAIGTRRQRA